MSQVEFDEFKIDEIRRPQNISTFITNLVIKMGLAKDKNSANVAMIVISIICIAIAVYFII